MADNPKLKFLWKCCHALFAGLILFLSSIPPSDLQEVPHLVSDKVLHFCEYGIFGFLGAIAYLTSPGRIWYLLLFGAVFAGLDEYWQSFAGRDSDLADFGADQAGHVLGALIGFWMAKRRL